jgi:hypothetical protein
MTEKAVAYRSVLIVGSIKHCRKHKRAEARIPILTLVTYLSDNAKGTCYLSITKVMELLDRSRQCVVDNILGLEEDGLIGVARVDGMPNCYWPRIPAALKEMSPNPIWVIDALTTVPKARIFGSVEEAMVAATERSGNQSGGVDQSGRVDRYRSSGVDPTRQVRRANQSSLAGKPVHSSTLSISSLNLFSSSRGVIGDHAVDATKKGAGDPDGTPGKASSISQAVPGSINGKSAMVAALGGQGAYAARNIMRQAHHRRRVPRGVARNVQQDAGAPRSFWNEDVLRDSSLAGEPLVITEGEFDALAAIQAGFLRTISVPDGAGSNLDFAAELWPLLKNARQVILAGAAMNPGRSSTASSHAASAPRAAPGLRIRTARRI